MDVVTAGVVAATWQVSGPDAMPSLADHISIFVVSSPGGWVVFEGHSANQRFPCSFRNPQWIFIP